MLFVDYIFLFCDGSKQDASKLKEVLDLYCFSTGMLVIIRKSYISLARMEKEKEIYFTKLLGFYLKAQRLWEKGLGMAYFKSSEETRFGVINGYLGKEG